ncbi:MAG: hypothetical protein JWO19_4508 [Bryobacterales bacterium]|nr:hypothetical protein [Bryobacterales bacterium]
MGVKASQNKKQKPALRISNPNNDQRGTDATPLIIETHTRPDSPEEAAKHKAENDTKEYRDRWTFRLAVTNAIATGVLVIFTGGLVIVGWHGVNAALRTLGAIDRQADLMDLQLTPWATVQNWQTEMGSLSSNPKVLTVIFEAINESNFPLTTVGTLDFFGRLPQAAHLVIPAMTLLPKRPLKLRVNLYLSDAQATEYTRGQLRIAVHGEVSYIGVSDRRSSIMQIHGNITCGLTRKTELEFESISLTPVQRVPEQRDDEAN